MEKTVDLLSTDQTGANALRRTFKFSLEFFKNPAGVASLVPSSRFLINKMVEPLSPGDAAVVEFGSGEGCITKRILEKIAPEGKLVAFEVNPEFVRLLRAGHKDKRFVLLEKSAEKIADELNNLGIKKVDAIVSSLSLAFLSPSAQEKILEQAHATLKNHGKFIQYHYALRPFSVFKYLKKYKQLFKKVKVCFVLFNFPPTFVFWCEK